MSNRRWIAAIATLCAVPLLVGMAAAAPSLGTETEPVDFSGAYACRQDTYIFEVPPGPGHVASLVEADNGDIVFAFEGHSRLIFDPPDGRPSPEWIHRTYLMRLAPSEYEFTHPQAIPNDMEDYTEHHRVLWNNGEGRLLHFFSMQRGPTLEDWELDIRTSDDHGVTWSEMRIMREELGWMFGTRPLRMSNGQVLLPVYREGGTRGVGFFVSDDDFETWEIYPKHEHQWPGGDKSEGVRGLQATVVETRPGHLLAYLRTSAGLIYETRSFNYGRTWTQARPTELPNPGSRIDLLQLDSGNLLLAYNPTTSSPRSPLRLILSEDGGETWPYSVDVEDHPEGRFDYPYLLQSSDGVIHLGYTHWRRNMRHVVFNEDFVRAGVDIPSDTTAEELEAGFSSRTEYRDGELETVDACAYTPGGGG